MIVLALDTTTRAGGVAVLENDRVLAEVAGDEQRTQGERLPADLLQALASAGHPLGGVDLFAVASGPGSFTGLRVGIATMQGLAFATGRRVAPVSALEALAHAAVAQRGTRWVTGDPIVVLMDAHRREVFGQVWVIDPSESDPVGLVPLTDPFVESRASVLDRLASLLDGAASTRSTRGVWFIGDGVDAAGSSWDDSAAQRRAAPTFMLPTPPTLAVMVGRLAFRRGPAAAVSPHAVQPLYIRRSYAELARDRLLISVGAAPRVGPTQKQPCPPDTETASERSPWPPEGRPASDQGRGGPLCPPNTETVAEHWTVTPMDGSRDLEAVLLVDDESFVNPWTRDMYIADLVRSDVSFIHVLRGRVSGLVGVCSAWVVADELHINNVAIRPAWRRRGLGRALLIEVLAAAALRGASRSTLEVRRSNTAALNLYAGLGFREAGTRRDYYRNPVEDALILWKDAEGRGGS